MGTTKKIFRFSPVDVVLFLRALAHARTAQQVRQKPVGAVVEAHARRGGGGGGYPIHRVELAVRRAIWRWRRWFGGIDSCLTRSLALGGMLAGRGDVILNIGFRAGEDEPVPDGHAWLTVDGSPVGADGALAEERYTRVLAVPFTSDQGDV
jgi:hypothetical protein